MTYLVDTNIVFELRRGVRCHEGVASWFAGVDDNSADEPGEPRRVLLEEMKRRGIGDDRVAVLGIGEQRVFVPTTRRERDR